MNHVVRSGDNGQSESAPRSRHSSVQRESSPSSRQSYILQNPYQYVTILLLLLEVIAADYGVGDAAAAVETADYFRADACAVAGHLHGHGRYGHAGMLK